MLAARILGRPRRMGDGRVHDRAVWMEMCGAADFTFEMEDPWEHSRRLLSRYPNWLPFVLGLCRVPQ